MGSEMTPSNEVKTSQSTTAPKKKAAVKKSTTPKGIDLPKGDVKTILVCYANGDVYQPKSATDSEFITECLRDTEAVWMPVEQIPAESES